MSEGEPGEPPAPRAIAPLSTASFFAVVSGVVSIVVPYLLGLTVALAALAPVAWLVERQQARRKRWLPGTIMALALSAAGAAVSLLLPPNLATFHGPMLGAATIPLWWSSRSHPASGSSG